MRLVRVEFNGYKRLAKASCNVDGRTIAFIGPNEAGKSSILTALEWLTDPSRSALPARAQNREAPPAASDGVVRCTYKLEDSDLSGHDTLGLDTNRFVDGRSVTEFRLSKRPDGTLVTGLTTTLERNRRPFTKALEAVEKLQPIVASASSDLEQAEISGDFESWIAQARVVLDDSRPEWGESRVSDARAIYTGLDTILEELGTLEKPAATLKRLGAALGKLLPTLDTAIAAGTRPDPGDAIRALLLPKVPRFVLFGEEDRNLDERYNLNDEALRKNPPSPLKHLLDLCDTNTEDLYSTITSGDPARLRTLERRTNQALMTKIRPMWTQSQLTVEINVNDSGTLEVNIEELDSPNFTVTPIAERSDGLRTFLGLVCFLLSKNLDIPPVLMIDEAERNLHYDAQADLVRVLTKELRVHKVIYTTHSPGCLPLDLGTGIRVVKRAPGGSTSTLENNFWTSEEPGFSHLLFAMGAEAATFSALRKAVLAEGISESILLPTLLRNATDGTELDFQVAFGLSNLSASSAISPVALVTTFLVDGDRPGREKKAQLLMEGVPESHVFQLPVGLAIEDLIDKRDYFTIVSELLAESSRDLPQSALDGPFTVARNVDSFAKQHLNLPKGVGHKIIATRLAALGGDLRLNRQGRAFLKALRKDLEEAFESPYVLNRTG